MRMDEKRKPAQTQTALLVQTRVRDVRCGAETKTNGRGITRAGCQRDEQPSRRVYSQSQRLPLPVLAAPLPAPVLPLPVVLPAAALAPDAAAELVPLPVLPVACPLSVTVN